MWTFQIRSLCLCFLLIFCKKYGSASSNYNRSQMSNQLIGEDNTTEHSILEFLDDHIDELKFPKHKDIVFVIGAEDSNKTTLISLITDVELEAIETRQCCSGFDFVDKDGPLNQYPENIVPELIPQLLTDKQRGVDYYILPNFNVATDVRSDLTAWHLMQRSLQLATGVKFMFTLNYSRKEIIQKIPKEVKQKVRHLVRDANLLINDINKYSEAISLTVTNVEYNANQSDINEIEHVAYVLRDTQNDLLNELINNSNPEESAALNQDIDFLEILLEKKRFYKKINIMRVANETGLVRDMAIFQNEKVEIMSMVRRNTKYIPNDENDFSFNISNKTKDRVPKLAEEIERRVSADISMIEKRIKDTYMEMEEEQFDLNALFDKMGEGFEKISQINAADPRSLVQEIIHAAGTLKIEISSSILGDTLKHIELCYFLKSLEGQHKSKFFYISDGVAETKKYLDESKTWYAFLLKLHDDLSEFKVQQNVTKFEEVTAHVMELCTVFENEEKNVTDIGLKSFLADVGSQLDPRIETMTVNSFKLRRLKDVLHRTMSDHGTKFCSPKKLSVQGYNVKISDVIEMKCPGDITFREIFVMNKVFIDVDVKNAGIKLQLIIIAPTWEIIGKRKITLNGKDGEQYSKQAKYGTVKEPDGTVGQPGKPGFSAGCFMAIGGKFINDEHLTVQLTGGKGGTGQEGGKGFNGKSGGPPEVPEASFKATRTWDRLGYEYDVIYENKEMNLFLVRTLKSKYKVSGRKAEQPGSGGSGGAKGFGGLKGKTFFVGIEQTPQFSVDSKKGPKGSGGIGGIGGDAAFDGIIEVISYKDTFALLVLNFNNYKVVSIKTGKYYAKGEDGKNDKNDAGIEEPEPAKFVDRSHSVNSYKSYLRENLAENIQESRVRKFMLDLEADESIRSLYNTMSFVNELESLESHYLRLRNKIPFFPFCESLKDRISVYTKSNNESAEHKKVLKYLYTSVIGKVSHLRSKENLRNFKNQISIIDLSEYLEIVQKSIRKMNEIENELSVTEKTEEYQKTLKDKIDSAIKMVNKEIIPVLTSLFGPLSREIIDLLEEVTKNRDKTKKEQEIVEAQIRNQQIFGGLKSIGAILQAFGPAFNVIGTFIEMGATIAEGLANSALLEGLEKSTKPIKDLLKLPFRLYFEQLKHMHDLLGYVNVKSRSVLSDTSVSTPPIDESKTIVDIKNTIKNYKLEVNIHLESKTYVDVKNIYNMRKDLGKQITDASTNCKFMCKEIEKLEKVNKLGKIAIDVWNEIKDNSAKLNEMYDVHKRLQSQFNMWDNRIDQIQDVLLPMMFEVEETMTKITDSIGNKSQVELDIAAWNVQSSMRDFKLLTRQMADETTHSDSINIIIDHIEDAFGTMIDIYDRIQSFMDQSKFAGFLSGIQSPNNQDIKDPALRKTVLQLKRVLQSNLVLEQYDLAIHSFKQHFFPFAVLHLANFDLPTELQVNDTVALVREAGEEIDYLQDEIKFLDVSLGRFDREIFGDINFSSNNISIAEPFYIFRSREFKDVLKKLLTGEEIMIKADIVRGLSQNAIKFNEIGIQLKLIDEQRQNELDAILENFGVRMRLAGHIYYKCGQRFYYLPVDDNVVIEYSFKKNAQGKPLKYNEVYRKLSGKHYFLSPYSTWKIQIVIDKDFDLKTEAMDSQSGYEKLAKFAKSSFNLELVGRGQYFRSNGTLEEEICTDVVEKYYEFDNSLTDVFSPQRLMNKYSLK